MQPIKAPDLGLDKVIIVSEADADTQRNTQIEHLSYFAPFFYLYKQNKQTNPCVRIQTRHVTDIQLKMFQAPPTSVQSPDKYFTPHYINNNLQPPTFLFSTP